MKTLTQYLEQANKSQYVKPRQFLFSGNLSFVLGEIQKIYPTLKFTHDTFGDFHIYASDWETTTLGTIQKVSDNEYGFIISNCFLDTWIHTIYSSNVWQLSLPNLEINFKKTGERQSGLEFTRYFEVSLNGKTKTITANNGFGESAESLFRKRVRNLLR